MTEPNILLIILDSVRARNTSLHGHVHNTTPFLKNFAEDTATWYPQTRSPGVWSLPSHVSIFTGLHVAEHQFTERNAVLVEGVSIWEKLKEYGYSTGLFSGNPYLTELPLGLSNGFDTVFGGLDLPYPEAMNPREFLHEHGQGQIFQFVKRSLANEKTFRSLVNGASVKFEDIAHLLPSYFSLGSTGKSYVDEFLAWEEEQSGQWAACLNLMDAHTPYEPTEPHDLWGGPELLSLQGEMNNQIWEFYGNKRPWWQITALEALYDGAIHQMDSYIRRVIKELDSRDKLENSLVVITSDHGEGFGEKSPIRVGKRIAGHQGRGIEEELLHVPLVVKYPNQEQGRSNLNVASLTEFSNVVTSLVEDESNESFGPEGIVLASSFGLDDQKKEIARRYGVDAREFQIEGHAAFSGKGNKVNKSVSWGNENRSFRIRDAEVSYRVHPRKGNSIDEIIRNVSRSRISEPRGEKEISERTEDRLKELGYL